MRKLSELLYSERWAESWGEKRQKGAWIIFSKGRKMLKTVKYQWSKRKAV